jgi:Tol biopolymer transport system component
VLEVSGLLIDSTNGSSTRLDNYPKLSGAPHPSFGAEGKMFASDGLLPDATIPESKRPWLVIVGETATGRSVTIEQFDNSRGAASWRKSHPHPIFSADGRRLYFNVSEGPWTQLYVAEIDSSTGTSSNAASR